MPPAATPAAFFVEPSVTASPLRLALAGALLGLQLVAHAAPTAPVVTFDTTPRAGQHQRQRIDVQAVMKMRLEAGPEASDEQRAKIGQAAERMAQMGPLKMSMQMQQTLKVGQPDADGWLPLSVAASHLSGQIEAGGKVTPMPARNGDLGITARFNPRDFAFEVQDAQGAPEMAEMMRTRGGAMVSEALQLFKALSQRPMKVGDSVEVPFNMALPVPLPGGAGNMQSKVRYTLVRVERGVAHFDLGLDMTMDVNTPAPPPASAASAASAPEGDAASAPAAAPRMMNMQLSGKGKGSSSLRLADRLPLASKLGMDMQMTLQMPDNGRMAMDMTMVTTSKGESLAKPAAKKKP